MCMIMQIIAVFVTLDWVMAWLLICPENLLHYWLPSTWTHVEFLGDKGFYFCEKNYTLTITEIMVRSKRKFFGHLSKTAATDKIRAFTTASKIPLVA